MSVLIDLPAEAPVVEPEVTLRSLERRGQRPRATEQRRRGGGGSDLARSRSAADPVRRSWLGCSSTASASGASIFRSPGVLAIAEYVWWIALASGGTIVSALFFLTRSPWRSATNRIAESMLLSAAPCAGLMPIMHLGRQGLFYWLFPYSNVMGVWPQVRSPLWWDFICLLCYILMSIMYYYAGLLPDLATSARSGQDAMATDRSMGFWRSAGGVRPAIGATSRPSTPSCRRLWRRW